MLSATSALTSALPVPNMQPAGTPPSPGTDQHTSKSIWGTMFRHCWPMQLSPLHMWTVVRHGIFRHDFERIGMMSQKGHYMGTAGYGILYSAARVYPEAADVLRSHGHRLPYSHATPQEQAKAAAIILRNANANMLGWRTGYLMDCYYPSPDALPLHAERTEGGDIVFERTTHIGGLGETVREATLDEVCADLQEYINLDRRIELAMGGYHSMIWSLHDYAQIGSQRAHDALAAIRKLDISSDWSDDDTNVLLARAGNAWAIWNLVNRGQAWWEPHYTLTDERITGF